MKEAIKIHGDDGIFDHALFEVLQGNYWTVPELVLDRRARVV